MTSILGPSETTPVTAATWAAGRGAPSWFCNLAQVYWQVVSGRGKLIRPEVAYCQFALETGFGRFGGSDPQFSATPDMHNPCGLKTADGQSTARFPTWWTGITAHVDHLSLYAGAHGYPLTPTPDPRHFPQLLGMAPSAEGLGGRWCPDPEYGKNIVLRINDLIALNPKEVPVGYTPLGEPPVTIRAAHDSGTQSQPVTRWVIHDEEFPVGINSGEDIANYFAGPGSGGSAHYVFDGDGEEHCVPEDTIAWHAPPNDGSLGGEHDGYAHFTRGDWLQPGSLATLHWSARRAADICTRYAIPVKKIGVNELLAGERGICGHADVSAAWHQSDHDDPGTEFPWDVYFNMINDVLNPPENWKVKPMYNPPIPLEPIAASAPTKGGCILGSIGGGIYTFGTPFHGSPEADPANWGDRKLAEVRVGNFPQNPYTVKDTAGEYYDYGYQPGQAPPRW